LVEPLEDRLPPADVGLPTAGPTPPDLPPPDTTLAPSITVVPAETVSVPAAPLTGNVTCDVLPLFSPIRWSADGRSGRQVAVLTNVCDQPIQGPVRLVLTGLSKKVRLKRQPVANVGTLAPGQTVSLVLRYAVGNGNVKTRFAVTVVSGP
jgi:hypothetical protein